ncbi:hypothetical protein COO60DRAFT_293072, partial [Scenedesmus sp. NREL 46B-D3]
KSAQSPKIALCRPYRLYSDNYKKIGVCSLAVALPGCTPGTSVHIRSASGTECMAAETKAEHSSGYTKPKYGKEVVGKRIRVLTGKDWRTGVVKAYHGGYYKHQVEFDDGETVNIHLHLEEYQFLQDKKAAEAEDLVGATVSVLWDENKWYRGTVAGFDGFMHTVVYDDDDTEHLTLQKGRFKVLEGPGALPPKPRSAAKAKAEAAPPGQGPASTAAHAAKQRQATTPLAASKAPASKAGGKAASGGSTGGGGGQGATSAAAVAENGKPDAGRGAGRDDRERRSSGSGDKERDRALRDANGTAGGVAGA